MNDYRISKYIKKVFETPSDRFSEWFVYYNYYTFTRNHRKLLCNRIAEDGVPPRADLKVEVGYYEIPFGEWHHVGFSDSWNWQQGCMAQWLNDDEIIYNTSENNHHIAIIYDTRTGNDRKIDWAVYGIMPGGKKSIALDMERAHWCRAYHYQSVKDKSKDGSIFEGDGIFEIDLVSNTRRRIISIQDILSLDPKPYFTKAKHWLEHIMINQDGTKFCVLHRFSSVTNVYSYKTRLIVIDASTLEMQSIDGWENTQWSHFGWNGNDFAIYAYPTREKVNEKDFEPNDKIKSGPFQLRYKPKFSMTLFVKMIARNVLPTRALLKMKGGITTYQYYTQKQNKKYCLQRVFDVDPFLTDGHPSFTPDGRYMITDTYPDKYHCQRLYVYDLQTSKYLLLGAFNAYYDKNPASCDLHPKLSRDGMTVVVDSAHDQKHHMLVLDLDWNLIKKQISQYE